MKLELSEKELDELINLLREAEIRFVARSQDLSFYKYGEKFETLKEQTSSWIERLSKEENK